MKLAPRTSIREQYSAKPSAKEKRFHIALMQGPCAACGIEPCGVFHHLMSEAPGKRWKRDHEFGLNLCDECHRALHRHGSEYEWCFTIAGFCPVRAAVNNRLWGMERGYI